LNLAIFNNYDAKINKFINITMREGKKQYAYNKFLLILAALKREFKRPPRYKLITLLNKMDFPFKVTDVVVAKIKFKTPHYIKRSRAILIQYLNIIKCAEARDENSFFERVKNEFVDYAKGTGAAYKLFSLLKEQISLNKAHGRFKI
jgi:ribosomal protein S7